MAATDLAGNWTWYPEYGSWSKWRHGPVFRVGAHQENSPQITYTGDWTRVASAGTYGGYVQKSTTPGAKATFTFKTANVGVVMPRRSDLGTVKICLDPGTVYQKCMVVDLSPSKTSLLGNRKLVWVRNNLDPATQHTVSVTVESGRVDLDAFVLAWFFSTNI